MKDSPELLDTTNPLNHSFSINQKILSQKIIPCPKIKNYEKKEIKVDKNYTLRENMEEKDIIPGLDYENEEDIKNIEKSLERSIDKSFDKSYDRSYDKSLNNNSLNQSDNQNLTQSNNQSLSYNDTSLNGSRNSTTEGNAIMFQLHKLLSGSVLTTNVEVEDENEEENEEDNSINKEEDEDKKQDNNESLSSNKDENDKKMNNSS